MLIFFVNNVMSIAKITRMAFTLPKNWLMKAEDLTAASTHNPVPLFPLPSSSLCAIMAVPLVPSPIASHM